ncbi:MAG: tRNA-dihydrouridine synthase family protein [Planctomycetes bacterium]|nr:tRNA-dihydrouridine synthase family protein [Planctomycetota bacterium]
MSLDLSVLLDGAFVMAPMTKGSNLPYRRLCDELGATITMGEMAVARRLKKRSRPEFALIRRHPAEKVFGVQLAGRDPDEMAWAAALAVERGADLVDINLGCPIHEITRRGLGSALLEKPRKVREMVSAMKAAVGDVPVTVKIRLAWAEGRFVHVKIARAAVDGGADGIVVHGRTRQARYRRAADWEKIGEVVQSVPVPVVGNGDIQFPHEIEAFRTQAGCAGVMIARGALIKPWIFKEAVDGAYWDISAAERVGIGRRYVALAREHWGEDDRGLASVRRFLLWHLDFWYRYVPRYPDGRFPKLQERGDPFEPRSELEAVLSRPDPAAHGWIADLLIHGEERAGPIPQLPSEEDLERHRDPIPQG